MLSVLLVWSWMVLVVLLKVKFMLLVGGMGSIWMVLVVVACVKLNCVAVVKL